MNGLNPRSHAVNVQVPVDGPDFVMIPWPFLFCQKPIVSAPVFTGLRQTFAVTEALPVSFRSLSRSCTVNVAVLVTVTHPFGGTLTVRG